MTIIIQEKTGAEIEATFFGESCNKWAPLLEEGKVYAFTKARIGVSNPRFAQVKNDTCITIWENSEIVEQ